MRPMRVFLAGLIALVVASPAAAESLRPTFAPSTGFVIGPIDFDAPIADIRAALPDVAWEERARSPFSGRVFGAAADRAVEIGGATFSVEIVESYYDRALVLHGGVEAATVSACDKAVFDFLAALEPGVGPLSGGEPRRTEPTGGGLYWSTTRQANGGVTVTPSPRPASPGKAIDEIVAFGEGSTANLYATDDDNRTVRRNKFGAREPNYYSVKAWSEKDHASVRAEASYFRFSGGCEMMVVARAWMPLPDPTYLSFESSKVVSKPTIAERHFITSMIEGGLSAPEDYTFDCLLSRLTERSEVCSKKTVPAAAEERADFSYKAARLLAEDYQFDLDGVDLDDTAPLRMIVPARLDPSDIVSLGFVSKPRTPLTIVRFTDEPDADALARAVSHVYGGDGRARTIMLICEVETDGSLVCAGGNEQADAAYQAAAREVSLAYRAGGKLSTGAPSAGSVIELAIALPAAE